MLESTDRLQARILIVDDQESNVRLLGLTVRRGGFVDVTSTTEPGKVAALHLQNPYALMILDLQMPGMSGFEVMQKLEAAGTRDGLVILVMSADPNQMSEALKKGADSFLSKPFILTEVLARVNSLLAERAESIKASRRDSPDPIPSAA